jgi:hypothetical protein
MRDGTTPQPGRFDDEPVKAQVQKELTQAEKEELET